MVVMLILSVRAESQSLRILRPVDIIFRLCTYLRGAYNIGEPTMQHRTHKQLFGIGKDADNYYQRHSTNKNIPATKIKKIARNE